MSSGYLESAESVTNGHPDKICDQISDALLDAYLAVDEDARVAAETLVSGNTVIIAGEITSRENVDVAGIARKVIADIGYTNPSLGFHAADCLIMTNINKQSPDIAIGVKNGDELGGGDQGIMYGYACDETKEYMPLCCMFAHKLTAKLQEVRESGLIPWLAPDGKAQVTMKYDSNGVPRSLTSVVVSVQHEDIDIEYLRSEISTHVIEEVIGSKYLRSDTRIHINPTGRFVLGGPAADTGLTGRKIMVDSYGGIGRHGGGAFSGKDPTKVDRTGAYMARYAAKNIVAAGLAARCEVAIAYVIGKKEPEAVNINTFGTEKVPTDIIQNAACEVFSFRVSDMIDALELRKPQFQKTASYGHFGRNEGFRWEETDKVQILRELCINSIGERLKQERRAP